MKSDPHVSDRQTAHATDVALLISQLRTKSEQFALRLRELTRIESDFADDTLQSLGPHGDSWERARVRCRELHGQYDAIRRVFHEAISLGQRYLDDPAHERNTTAYTEQLVVYCTEVQSVQVEYVDELTEIIDDLRNIRDTIRRQNPQ